MLFHVTGFYVCLEGEDFSVAVMGSCDALLHCHVGCISCTGYVMSFEQRTAPISCCDTKFYYLVCSWSPTTYCQFLTSNIVIWDTVDCTWYSSTISSIHPKETWKDWLNVFMFVDPSARSELDVEMERTGETHNSAGFWYFACKFLNHVYGHSLWCVVQSIVAWCFSSPLTSLCAWIETFSWRTSYVAIVTDMEGLSLLKSWLIK